MLLPKSLKLHQRGFGLLEIVVGAALLLLLALALTTVWHTTARLVTKNLHLSQANFLLTEGVEAVKLTRDAAWKNVASTTAGTIYRLNFNGAVWQLATTSPIFITGLFDRTVVFGQVYRNGSSDIAPSGTLDPNTRQVTVAVAWRENSATTTNQLITYITNVFNN